MSHSCSILIFHCSIFCFRFGVCLIGLVGVMSPDQLKHSDVGTSALEEVCGCLEVVSHYCFFLLNKNFVSRRDFMFVRLPIGTVLERCMMGVLGPSGRLHTMKRM